MGGSAAGMSYGFGGPMSGDMVYEDDLQFNAAENKYSGGRNRGGASSSKQMSSTRKRGKGIGNRLGGRTPKQRVPPWRYAMAAALFRKDDNQFKNHPINHLDKLAAFKNPRARDAHGITPSTRRSPQMTTRSKKGQSYKAEIRSKKSLRRQLDSRIGRLKAAEQAKDARNSFEDYLVRSPGF